MASRLRIDNVRFDWVEDGFDEDGELQFGCTAVAEVSYDIGGGNRRLETLSSGGLYGITFAVADDPYKREVEREQLNDLRTQLAVFGVSVTDRRIRGQVGAKTRV